MNRAKLPGLAVQPEPCRCAGHTTVAGLYLVRDRIDTIGYGPTTRLIASFPLLALIPLCFLPETSGQSLEALNDEELPELGSTTVEDEDLGLDEPAIHPIDPTALN